MDWLYLFGLKVWPALYSTAAMLLICIAVEYASPKVRYSLRSRLHGILAMLAVPIAGMLLAVPILRAIRSLGIGPVFHLGEWAALPAILLFFVAKDFFNYWEHRFEHRFLWPIHAAHHAPAELHAANGAPSLLTPIVEVFIISAPLSFLFGGLAVPLAVGLFVQLQTMITHCPTRVNYGPLAAVFVDNRFHRIHHSIEERHFDRNFGTVFSVWDRLFGTHYAPGDEWPETGVPGIASPKNFWQWLVVPYRAMKLKRHPMSR